jgi:hypothetical protein
MSITEQDELEHPASDDWLWRESLYFNFHDVNGKVGGSSTIGILPNQNRVQGLATIFLKADQVLFYHTETLPETGNAGLCSVPGITYEMLTPLQKWRFAAAAHFSHIDPRQVVRGVRSPKITVPAGFDLTFDALSPAYEFLAQDMELLSGRSRHFEQNGHIDGKVTIGDRTFAVTGFGFRDHSWGIRDLSRADHMVTIFAQFGPHFHMNAVWRASEERELATGYIVRHGVNTPISDIQVAVETDSLSNLPEAAQAEIGTVDGQRFSLQAVIHSVMPILLDHGGARLHWYECSTYFRHEGQVGYGILELTTVLPFGQSS